MASGAVRFRRPAAWSALVGLSALTGAALGEYELDGAVGVVAGVVLGAVAAEILIGGGERTRAGAALAALVVAGAMLMAGWRDTAGGVEPYPPGAVVGAGAGAVVAAARVARSRPGGPRAGSGS